MELYCRNEKRKKRVSYDICYIFFGAFIGAGAGFALALLRQLMLEEKYKRDGAVMIAGDYYTLTKIDLDGEGEGDERERTTSRSDKG